MFQEDNDLEFDTGLEGIENLSKEELIGLIKEYYKCTQEMNVEMERLRFVAYCDALTTYTINNSLNFEDCKKKIFNRTYWESEYKNKHLYDELDFYLIDLNDLKKMNDNYGHLAGDKMICDCARLLYDYGTTFRLGGDEFAMITYNPESTRRFNKFLLTAKNLNFAHGHYHKKANDDFDYAMKMADNNMYCTKARMKSDGAKNLKHFGSPKQLGEE